MIAYFIKSGLVLLALLIVFHLFLEKEKMHHFNRFYLLFSLVFSFVIPFITIEVIDESANVLSQTNTVIPGAFKTLVVKETIDFVPIICWSIYAIITGILLFRFFKNIKQINSKAKSNVNVTYQNAKLVLLKEELLPHTFLNYIFVNENEYQNHKIEDELFTHELIHVTQKHTFDILFIEFLKAVFWFNPIFIFYKKAIQLNHEFLADEKVVKSFNNVAYYQSLLVSKINLNTVSYLTSNLNYLVTKKRLIMMTKTTSVSVAMLKKIALIPLFLGMVFLVCIETIAQEKSTIPEAKFANNKIETISSKTERRDQYYAGVQIIVKEKNRTGKIILDKKYEELTLTEKDRYLVYVPEPLSEKQPTETEFNNWKDKSKFAVWLDGKNIPNSELNKFEAKDISYFSGSFVYKNARTAKHPQSHQFWLYTQDYFDQNLKKSHLKFGGKTLEIVVPKAKPELKQESQEETEPKKNADTTVTVAIDKQPEFPGGIAEFYKFVGKNFKMPAEVSKNKIEGKIYMEFMIEKDGSLSEIKFLKGLEYGLGDEAIRVLKLSPKWIPASKDGEPVRVLYSLPISIKGD